MNCYELFRIVQFSHVFTDVLHSMCNVLLRRVKPQCPEPAAKVAMGNVSCHPREKPSDDAELVVQNVQNDNPMHFRRLQRSHFSWNHLEHVSCPPFLEFRQLEVLVVHLYLQHMLIHWSFNGPIVIHTASHSTISHVLAAAGTFRSPWRFCLLCPSSTTSKAMPPVGLAWPVWPVLCMKIPTSQPRTAASEASQGTMRIPMLPSTCKR